MLWSIIDTVKKGYMLTGSHGCIVGSGVQLIELTFFFFKFSPNHLLASIQSQAQVFLGGNNYSVCFFKQE